MESDIKQSLDRIESKIDDLLRRITCQRPKEQKPAESKNKGTNEVIEGVVKYAEIRQGKKSNYLVFKLINKDGEENAKTFKPELFDLLAEEAEVKVKGFHQEWKGFQSFIINEVIASKIAGAPIATQEEDDDTDNVPF